MKTVLRVFCAGTTFLLLSLTTVNMPLQSEGFPLKQLLAQSQFDDEDSVEDDYVPEDESQWQQGLGEDKEEEYGLEDRDYLECELGADCEILEDDSITDEAFEEEPEGEDYSDEI